jgi:hypothetical protein
MTVNKHNGRSFVIVYCANDAELLAPGQLVEGLDRKRYWSYIQDYQGIGPQSFVDTPKYKCLWTEAVKDQIITRFIPN